MKKIILSLALTVVWVAIFAQHPIGSDSFNLQTVSNSLGLFKSKGAIGSDSGFVNAAYADTSAANRGKLKNYPGAQIRVGDSIWVRNSTATAWLNISAGGSSGITNITGLIEAGTNVNISGTGATGDPYIVNAEDSDAFHTTHQISDTCFLIRRPDGTEDTVCITGGVASGCANVSVSINGGTAVYPDGACNINITDTALNWTNLFSASFLVAGGISGSSTVYGQVLGRTAAYSALEEVPFVMSENFTMSRLFVRTTTSQPAGGNLVITLRVNSISTALTVSIPAGSSAGTFSDLTHSVSISAGDLIDWQIANGSGSTSATIASIGATGTGQ